MFDPAEVAAWNQTFRMAVEVDRKWKRIPASEGRLRAMAMVRGEIDMLESSRSLDNLTHQERVRLDELIELERHKEGL